MPIVVFTREPVRSSVFRVQYPVTSELSMSKKSVTMTYHSLPAASGTYRRLTEELPILGGCEEISRGFPTLSNLFHRCSDLAVTALTHWHPHTPVYTVYSVYKARFSEGFCMRRGLHEGLQGFTNAQRTCLRSRGSWAGGVCP